MTTPLTPAGRRALLTELENEVTGVVGFADLIRVGSARRIDYADEIIRAAQRLLRGLRALAEHFPDQGNEGACDPARVLLELQPMLHRIAGRGLSLSVRCDPALESIPIARDQLENLLLHLVAVSRDSSGASGTVAIRTLWLPSGRRRPDRAQILIEDGAGPLAADDPRWALTRTPEPKAETCPLEDAARVIRSAGGTIRIETRGGRWNVVEVELPLGEAP
jgi:hypothetical protein